MKQFLYAFGLFIALAAFSNDGLLKYYHLKRFEQNLSAKNKKIEDENKILRQEINELQSKKTIERHIRNTLGYVMDNELVFEIGDIGEISSHTPQIHIRFLGIY